MSDFFSYFIDGQISLPFWLIHPTFNIGPHKGRFSFKAFSTGKSMPSFFALAVHSEPHQEPLTQEMPATPKPAFSAGIKTNTGAGPAG